MTKFKNSAFIRFFTKFPKLLLAGLMFSLPLAAFTALFVAISKLTNFDNVIIWGLGIIPATPFLAGLTMVIRKYAVEKDDVNVIKTFFKAVKENLSKFILHGVIIYIIFACSFFALLYYYSLSQGDPVFSSVLTLYMIFTLLLIVMMYYVPIMTITYELSFKDIYKNSFLLIFGKIVRNIIATLSIAIVIAAAILLITFSNGIWFGISVALVVALLPFTVSYILISIISKGLQDSVGVFVGASSKSSEKLSNDEIDSANELISSLNSDNDYVFVNGKMIKNNRSENDSK